MKLNEIFSTNMVLQANKPIRIFGEGIGDISVEFAGIKTEKHFDSQAWMFELPALPYGGPFEMKTVINGKTDIFENVYIGDVYLMSGQSNMAFSVDGTGMPKEDYEEHQMLRCFRPRGFYDDGKTAYNGWKVSEKENIGSWSAVSYFMGRKLVKNSDRAIGVVFCYQGASVIESWIAKEKADEPRFYLPLEERYLIRSTEKDSPHNKNGALYSKVFRQIVPYSFAGVVWYQGESNTGTGDYKVYGELLKELIYSWRNDLLDEQLPFVIVQIADWDQRCDNEWKSIQRLQEKVASETENSVLVKSADICESNDIHPQTKVHLGERIADVFLKKL